MEAVYIVSAGPLLHKIGISNNISRRLGELQVGHSSPLRLVDFAASDVAAIVERRVHAALAGARLRGEWFAVSEDAALAAVAAAIQIAPEHAFARGDLVRCISVPLAPGLLPDVGAEYTVSRIYLGGQIDLLWLRNDHAAFCPSHFRRLTELGMFCGDDVI